MIRAYPRFHRGCGLDKKMIRFAVKEYCQIYHLDETIMDHKPKDVEEEALKEIFWISLIVQSPGVLVMEEPFYALDEVGRLYMHKYIKLLKEKNCAIIVCGKNQGEIEQFCDKTYCLL